MNRQWLAAGIIGLSVLSANPSYATKPAIPALFATVDNVSVYLTDNVNDGCLSQPESAKNAFKRELMQSGIKTKEYSGIEIYIFMHVFAVDDGLCFVTYDIEVAHWVYANISFATGEDKTIVPVVSYRDGGMYTRQRQNSQGNAEETLTRVAKDLITEWIILRQ